MTAVVKEIFCKAKEGVNDFLDRIGIGGYFAHFGARIYSERSVVTLGI